MPTSNPAALEFLLTRRSRPAKTLVSPAPDRAAIKTILQAGARSPDHGILEPWRFVVLGPKALKRIAVQVEARALELGKPPEQVEKARNSFAKAPLTIAVVASPKKSEKIPELEQTLSVGAVCLSVLNGALAMGWGANWVTGWAATDRPLLVGAFDLAAQEYIAGFVHLGTETLVPADRKRPDISILTDWVDA